jgi:hypothetical protein
MLRLVRQSKVERLLREKLDERERLVMFLVEQVEYLRSQLGAATTTVSRAASGLTPVATGISPPPDDVTFEIPPFFTDEADELHAMLQAEVISQAEYDEALSRLKTRDPDSIIE